MKADYPQVASDNPTPSPVIQREGPDTRRALVGITDNRKLAIHRQLGAEILDRAAHVGIHFHLIHDRLAGVDDRTVVATAESLADRHEGHAGELGGEVHGDLTGESDVLHPALGGHVGHLDTVVLGDLTLDDFGREGVAGFLDEDVMEELLDLGEFEGLAGHAGQTNDTSDSAFKVTDVAGCLLYTSPSPRDS